MARGTVTKWEVYNPETRERRTVGYIRNGVYVIRRTVKGKTYEISTWATTDTAAVAQLAKFEQCIAEGVPYEAAPKPAPTPPKAAPLLLDHDLVKPFLAWSKAEKHNSEDWVRKQQLALAWWVEDEKGQPARLAGIELRASPDHDLLKKHILPALTDRKSGKKVPGWKHKAAVLKAFYSWLREEKHEITLAQDPVVKQLKVPQVDPAQWKITKVISRQDLAKVVPRIKPPWQDATHLLMASGWHCSEVVRFVQCGAVEDLPEIERGPARDAKLMLPQTKIGTPLQTYCSAGTAEAARRLRERGTMGLSARSWENSLRDALHTACAEANVDPIQPGHFRHTVATHAIRAGATPPEVAAFLNHKSSRTTMRFYAAHSTPKKVPTLAD